MKSTKRSCPACDGRGWLWHTPPAELRRVRKASGITLRDMAKRLKFSAPYISDVELGKRAATERIVIAYHRLAEQVAEKRASRRKLNLNFARDVYGVADD